MKLIARYLTREIASGIVAVLLGFSGSLCLLRPDQRTG